MGLLRPRERVIVNAIRRESRIKYKAKRMHKRFRSWAQQRVREYWLPMNVSLTSQVNLMDGQYISACVQKAATLRKHDFELWKSYSERILEIRETLTPQQVGYIFYGMGKSRFLNTDFYDHMLKYVGKNLNNFYSHPLMCIAWSLNRMLIRKEEFFNEFCKTVISKFDEIRIKDLIKINTSIGRLGIMDKNYKNFMNRHIINKLDTIFAQDFRNVVNDITIINLYDDEAKKYILTRFTNMFICARPQHYKSAYKSAVAVRVLYPHVWNSLSTKVKSFYVRLSMRRIHDSSRKPSDFQWEVSTCLARLGIAHRNTFLWGCYYIDIGEINEKRNCWFVDGPSCFYTSTNMYTEHIKLQHQILYDLGWNIRRIVWLDWLKLGNDINQKIEFVKTVREKEPLGKTLNHFPLLKPDEIKNKLRELKWYKICKDKEKAHAQEQEKIHLIL
ncbi:heptatricopeptide repeat and RAP domain-containing protein [Plasmodium brasilianum]|uniref:RAP protein, putative n=2 Tax=Plasmodium (Plasmodium) TaxID=418103 RepID=A0A1A8WUY2_PLAMA|nr:RAP protein, putative [Plasmodium malariae]KAI4837939.1 heptatricopeptide repeat and RAP domain-containing protein [Plasmodium brasilianum]SBS96767.1 RAP protein, putative [Plasmodium malariae]SBT71841.1 RAP protein, putative [Plasmodium malariae]SCN45117.1 RAP protein, putative [Plasmodium malariae]